MQRTSSKKSDIHDAALGAAIRVRRLAVGLSLQALADRCELSLQQVYKYETGATRVPFSRLVRIARALGCGVSDLVPVLDQGTASGRAGLELLHRLGASGAVELLEAYVTLPPRTRRALVAFVEGMARARDPAS